MINVYYGERTIDVMTSKHISPKEQRWLADGRLVVEVVLDDTIGPDLKKIYYVGVLFEIFKANFGDMSKRELIAMIKMAYPVFMKERQFINTLSAYEEIKTHKDVFTTDR